MDDDSTTYDGKLDDSVDLNLPFLGIMGYFDRESGSNN